VILNFYREHLASTSQGGSVFKGAGCEAEEDSGGRIARHVLSAKMYFNVVWAGSCRSRGWQVYFGVRVRALSEWVA